MFFLILQISDDLGLQYIVFFCVADLTRKSTTTVSSTTRRTTTDTTTELDTTTTTTTTTTTRPVLSSTVVVTNTSSKPSVSSDNYYSTALDVSVTTTQDRPSSTQGQKDFRGHTSISRTPYLLISSLTNSVTYVASDWLMALTDESFIPVYWFITQDLTR